MCSGRAVGKRSEQTPHYERILCESVDRLGEQFANPPTRARLRLRECDHEWNTRSAASLSSIAVAPFCANESPKEGWHGEGVGAIARVGTEAGQ